MQTELKPEIQFLKGVGPKRALLLESELGIKTVNDLIRTYPYKYIDRSTIIPIADIRTDSAYIQVRARVVSTTLLDKSGNAVDPSDAKFNAVSRLSVMIADESAQMELVFFKGIKYMLAKLQPGKTFIFFGKPSFYNGWMNMVHPEVDDVVSSQPLPAGTMTGVYPSTEKLKNAGITGKVMNKIMAAALQSVSGTVTETLPEYILKEKGLVPLAFALTNIHFPKDMNALRKAEYRLKFEELFFLQLSLLKQKYIRSRNEHGIPMPKVGDAFNICYNALPYSLTGAQKRVIKEIRADMMSGRQMNRLLQGDVGSGKTMVAVLSALIAYGNGYQSCIMAPTEVLARQHFANIRKYLSGTGVEITILTGTTKASERRTLLADLASGKTGIIVGTHALIEDNVVFKRLGLAIIDEQHRFGVDQRARLWQKTGTGVPPHILVMTATPIPRTLAMTLYGDPKGDVPSHGILRQFQHHTDAVSEIDIYRRLLRQFHQRIADENIRLVNPVAVQIPSVGRQQNLLHTGVHSQIVYQVIPLCFLEGHAVVGACMGLFLRLGDSENDTVRRVGHRRFGGNGNTVDILRRQALQQIIAGRQLPRIFGIVQPHAVGRLL